MRIERVEGNKRVRVLLSEDDLRAMNINIKNLTPDSTELHRFLFDIMEVIKKETGFNPRQGQVMVEAAPRNDGVVLTVSKIEDRNEKQLRTIKGVRIKKGTKHERIYRFDNFKALCDYLKLDEITNNDKIKLYEYESMYYLVSKEAKTRINEFATDLLKGFANERFFKEHGRLIAENESFKNMIDSIKKLY